MVMKKENILKLKEDIKDMVMVYGRYVEVPEPEEVEDVDTVEDEEIVEGIEKQEK